MRYLIGIDLGTTNTAVAYVDTQDPKLAVRSFPIPQLTGPGRVGALNKLPSFCYLAKPNEWKVKEISLPWGGQTPSFFVGQFAKEAGEKVPVRLVQSAKSWLCHTAAARRDPLLPPEADDPKERISPVEATRRILCHVRDAWNDHFLKKDPVLSFDEQEIILTVPASFDEIARILTVEAAKKAGFVSMTLLEEPQAAFYCWMSKHENNLSSLINCGDTLLVCDIGGGTTDFSLIEANQTEEKLGFQRIAVGDHLLLGGDNMDAAVAQMIEEKLARPENRELSLTQRLQIKALARTAKESLLEGKEEYFHGNLLGRGSKVIGDAKSFSLAREEVVQRLLEGFFPLISYAEGGKIRASRGLRTFGLPYEDDPAITKHLAAFLQKRSEKPPKFILFNGGAMKAKLFQERIVSCLHQWFPRAQIQVLASPNLDLAVSQGAAYFGKARRGFGIHLRSGLSKALFLQVGKEGGGKEGEVLALTLLAQGAEDGASYEPIRPFSVIPNVPVSFQLLSSHVKQKAQSGMLIPIDPEEMQPLPPLQTVLKYGRGQGNQVTIPILVRLKAILTPIGTLEISLHAQETSHTWNLEFQLKTAEGQENSLELLKEARQEETLDVDSIQACKKVILDSFKDPEKKSLQSLISRLEERLEMKKK